MTLGSRARKRGTVTKYVGDGKYRVELDSGELVEAQLSRAADPSFDGIFAYACLAKERTCSNRQTTNLR